METIDIDHILALNEVRPSPVRTLVLKVMNASERPLSGQDIETALDSVDRSSITRTLSLFTERGIVHTVDDGSGSVKYELCRSCDRHDHHDDTHPHFHCIKCGETFCFNDQEIPKINLPEGFSYTSANYVIKGLCPRCQNHG